MRLRRSPRRRLPASDPAQAIRIPCALQKVSERRMELRARLQMSQSGMTSRITRRPSRRRFSGLRYQVGRARILAVLEPRSSTMKAGVMKDRLPASLQQGRQDFLL